MERKEVRNKLFQQLTPSLTTLGFTLIDKGQDPRYIKKDDEKIFYNFFNFHYAGVFFAPISISIHIVEDIILEIGLPNNSLISYIKKDKYFLDTVQFKKDKMPVVLQDDFPISSDKDINELATWIIDYIGTTGLPFAEYYSYLPNVLTEMNRLEAEGKYWNGILGGLADYLFRGLIISKLCNDVDFNRKVVYCDGMLNSRPSLNEWLPYYERLKERLAYLQPLYNV
jgi:hypothetical protein